MPKRINKSSKPILKTQQRFKSERHIVFIGEINKIALSSDDDKRMQSTDSTETYVYRMNKNLLCKEEQIKCDNILNQYKNAFFK